MCGGEKLRARDCYLCSTRDFIQESPNHGAATSSFAEIDLDHGAGCPALETLNQRK